MFLLGVISHPDRYIVIVVASAKHCFCQKTLGKLPESKQNADTTYNEGAYKAMWWHANVDGIWSDSE